MGYNEDMGEDIPESPALNSGESLKQKLSYHMEGLIPIILLIIIALFVLGYFKVINPRTPVIGPIANQVFGVGEPSKVLVLGQPALETMLVLNDSENRDLVRLTQIPDLESIKYNPAERISQYDIIWLDQSMQADKFITRRIGEAITDFVKTGGKLIIIGNSGIRRPNDPSILGWEATFGDIIPVNCEPLVAERPGCLNEIAIRGKIERVSEKHEVMEGIREIPATGEGTIVFRTFNVSPTGHEIAIIRDYQTQTVYPAIVEKPFLLGKGRVIYFNYNPGYTPAIIEKVISYLK